MGSLLGDWPSFDPDNFSQLRPTDPSIPSRIIPATYCATHDQTVPPPNQVIHTKRKNILIRKLHQKAEQKLRLKRGASDHLIQEHGCKQPRSSCGDA